jgi:uncharacterized membrane protein
LWRKSTDEIRVRSEEVARFYNGGDQEWQRDFIRRHRIRYIVIGDFERTQYPQLSQTALEGLGDVVQDGRSGTTVIETYSSMRKGSRSEL